MPHQWQIRKKEGTLILPHSKGGLYIVFIPTWLFLNNCTTTKLPWAVGVEVIATHQKAISLIRLEREPCTAPHYFYNTGLSKGLPLWGAQSWKRLGRDCRRGKRFPGAMWLLPTDARLLLLQHPLPAPRQQNAAAALEDAACLPKRRWGWKDEAKKSGGRQYRICH